jgi:excisionase family DNA binding protein
MEEKPSQPPILVTLSEAALLLSVSLRTVQRMVRAGKLSVIYVTEDAPRIAYAELLGLASQPSCSERDR